MLFSSFVSFNLVAAAMILLILCALCQAHPWSPHTFDSLEKDVLESAVQTTLTRLDAAIDLQINPVLANLTRVWGHVCMNGKANTILARSWPKEHYLKLEDRLAPWSMAVDTLRYASAMKQVTPLQFQKRCESTPIELLESIQNGERTCTLRLFTPEQTCKVLNKYSQIFWIGNSLTRHTLIGLLNLLSSNLQSIHKYTSNPRYPQFDILSKEAMKLCQCDGQYSVHSSCVSFYRQAELHEGIMNACSDIMGESFWKHSFQFQYMQAFQTKNQLHVSRCPAVVDPDNNDNDDIRPIFLYIQGGNDDSPVKGLNPRKMDSRQRQPYDFNIPMFFRKTLSTFIVQYEKFYQHCPNGKNIPLRIVFSGVNAQNHHPHEDRDSSYSSSSSHQNKRRDGDNGDEDARLLALNTQLLEYIQKWHPQVHALNFFNLTLVSVADSADGYHYLTSTNIQKAMTLLRLMDVMI